MNRKDKRAKRMRAREHQKTINGTLARRAFDKNGNPIDVAALGDTAPKDVTVIDTPRGPKPSPSFHKTDRPKYGQNADARALAIAELAEIGLVDPQDELITEYQRLKRAVHGQKRIAQTKVQEAIKAMNAGLQRAAETAKAITDAKPGQQVVADESGTHIVGKPSNHVKVDVLETEAMGDAKKRAIEVLEPFTHPSEEAWAELEAAAKKLRKGKKGYERVLDKAGYRLRKDGLDHDHRNRESWVLSHA